MEVSRRFTKKGKKLIAVTLRMEQYLEAGHCSVRFDCGKQQCWSKEYCRVQWSSESAD